MTVTAELAEPGLAEPRSVIGRAFSVLAAFDEATGSVTLARLAERTGLPKGSVHRLCAQLIDQGAIERTTLGYRLGFRLFELGSRASSPRRLRDLALPYLSELHTATRCAIHLSVLVDDDIFIINSVTGRAGVPLAVAPGGRRPALSAASGRALIAHSEPEVRAQYLQSPRVSPELRDLLLRISAGELATLWTGPRLQAIAAPVFDRNGHAIAAISACAQSFPTRHSQIDDTLRATAAAIEQQLRESPGSIWHR